MTKIAVLGAGLVGSVIAQDLARHHKVTSADASETALERLRARGIGTRRLDLTDENALRDFIAGADVVVSAVPSALGYRTLSTLVDTGCRIADIAFTPEDVLRLDERARATGAVLLTDIGVAPGVSNLILGHHDAHMKVSRFVCYVGGNPRRPQPPFRYRAAFAPSDVIEEYTRPARIQRNGEVVEVPALAEREFVHFEGTGEMEAFLTDGLRSILVTMKHIPEMIEKTLRWPGHVDIVHAMRDAGFFDKTPVQVGGASVTPNALATKLLTEAWRLRPGETDMLQMRVIVEGERDGARETHRWETQDHFDESTGFTAMARTTGYTCAAAASLLAEGRWTTPGVHPAEIVGRDDDAFDYIFKYLEARGVVFRREHERA